MPCWGSGGPRSPPRCQHCLRGSAQVSLFHGHYSPGATKHHVPSLTTDHGFSCASPGVVMLLEVAVILPAGLCASSSPCRRPAQAELAPVLPQALPSATSHPWFILPGWCAACSPPPRAPSPANRGSPGEPPWPQHQDPALQQAAAPAPCRPTLPTADFLPQRGHRHGCPPANRCLCTHGSRQRCALTLGQRQIPGTVTHGPQPNVGYIRHPPCAASPRLPVRMLQEPVPTPRCRYDRPGHPAPTSCPEAACQGLGCCRRSRRQS